MITLGSYSISILFISFPIAGNIHFSEKSDVGKLLGFVNFILDIVSFIWRSMLYILRSATRYASRYRGFEFHKRETQSTTGRQHETRKKKERNSWTEANNRAKEPRLQINSIIPRRGRGISETDNQTMARALDFPSGTIARRSPDRCPAVLQPRKFLINPTGEPREI